MSSRRVCLRWSEGLRCALGSSLLLEKDKEVCKGQVPEAPSAVQQGRQTTGMEVGALEGMLPWVRDKVESSHGHADGSHNTKRGCAYT